MGLGKRLRKFFSGRRGGGKRPLRPETNGEALRRISREIESQWPELPKLKEQAMQKIRQEGNWNAYCAALEKLRTGEARYVGLKMHPGVHTYITLTMAGIEIPENRLPVLGLNSNLLRSLNRTFKIGNPEDHF